MDDDKLHIVMLPWLAFGHLHPFLELSKSLAKRGHRISFVSTPRNLGRLPPLPPDLSPLIHFVPLPLPHVDGLPAHAEATADLPPGGHQLLLKAFDGLQQPFSRFVRESDPRPDWIVHDIVVHWAADAGAGVPCAYFSTVPASTFAFYPPSELREDRACSVDELMKPCKGATFPTAIAYRRHEAKLTALYSSMPNASGVPDWVRIRLALENAALLAERSCVELEPEWFGVLWRLYDKPVVPVGLLLSVPEGEMDGQLSEFLDGKGAGSVLYVALGSESNLPIELLQELASGIESSEVPFLWALRRPADEAGERFMEEFEGRTKERGLVVTGWAPQVKVLSHAAVGGFLTHCGWGSVIEGLQFGRPLVMLPLFGDQGLNARAMAEKGVGVEVERDEESGFFSGEAVAAAVRAVMAAGEGGGGVRAKAKKAGAVAGDRERQERCVDEFVKRLKDLRSK